MYWCISRLYYQNAYFDIFYIYLNIYFIYLYIFKYIFYIFIYKRYFILVYDIFYKWCIDVIHNWYIDGFHNWCERKGKVFNGREPPSGESTTTECGVNYQLLAAMYWSSQMGNSQLQSTTTSFGQWHQRRMIQLTSHTPHPHGQYSMRASCIV